MLHVLALALLISLCAPAARTSAAPPPKGLQGTWLFDSATLNGRSHLRQVWESVVTIDGDRFALTKLMGAKGELRGTLAFDRNDPSAVDLKVAELDLSNPMDGSKVPAGTLAGRYKLDGDRLTLCFPMKYAGKRPDKLESGPTTYLVTLARAPKDFKGFPQEITVTVVGADGKPAAGAHVGTFMVSRQDPAGRDADREWQYHDQAKTGPAGTVKGTFAEPPTVARDASGRQMAFLTPSPAQLATGRLRVALAPERRVTGRVVVEGPGPANATHVYLLRDGVRLAQIDLKGGGFDFPVTPGTYTVRAFGDDFEDAAISIDVPADKLEVPVGPLVLKPSTFALLKGKPAPALEGVVGWKGGKVALADLKGKYVLLDFWGYWCGGCVEVMPVLFDLHEKYADRGLAIVGVHVDIDGEVDSVAKYDAKVAAYKKGHWKGREPLFPIALVPGERSDAARGGPAAQYGVQFYPTTVLIDREGRVVGRFKAHDIKTASAEIEKLLNPKK